MSRLVYLAPCADYDYPSQYVRGNTPTLDYEEFGVQFRHVGASTLIDRRYDISMAAGGVNFHTLYSRFRIRIKRLPVLETVLWALSGNLEGAASVYITCTTLGVINVYNQGNQAQFNQLIGTLGTITLEVWNLISIQTVYRSDAAVRLPFCSATRVPATGTSGSFSVTLPVPGGGFGLQNNGQVSTLQTVCRSGTPAGLIDFDLCDWSVDDAAFGAETRGVTLRPNAAGTYQEFATSGIADFKARSMWPIGATLLNSYARRTDVNGARQTYVFESFASKGITQITSAVLHISIGAGGNGAQLTVAPTLIIRRTTAAGATTETLVTAVIVTCPGIMNLRIDAASAWAVTDTIELGLRNNVAQGLSIGGMALTIETTTAYVAPTDTDFTIAETTWTGTGVTQAISLPDGIEPDFMIIYPRTANFSGMVWWKGMGSGHQMTTPGPTRTDLQVLGNTVYLIGNVVNGPNEAARVYDVLMIEDKTRRMLISGGIVADSTATWDVNDVVLATVAGETFQPEMLLGVLESTATSTAVFMRGPGNTGDTTGSMTAAASVANVFRTINASGMRIGNRVPGVVNNLYQFSWLAMRTSFIGSSFMSISTYTGNGLAARDITLNMPGYTPTWVIVQPLAATSTAIATPGTVPGRTIQTGVALSNSIYTIGENRVTVGLALNANAVVYNVLAFGVGADVEPEPPVPPDPYPGPALPPVGPVPSTLSATLLRLRRLRRSAHLSNEQFRVFFHRLQVDAQVGIGLSGADQVGTDPQMMLRWSDDAGQTWSNEHWVSMGKLGQYKYRAIFNRLGQGRNRVFEIAVSDPVAWRIVDAFIQASPGNN